MEKEIKRTGASSEQSFQKYFIIGRAQTPWGLKRKGRFVTQFQKYDESGIDTIPENEDAGGQFRMAPDVDNGWAGEPLEYIQKDVDRPIRTQKRRIESLRLEAKLGLSGKYSPPNMLNSRLNDESGANRSLIDEFKAQEDVKMRTQLPDYDDFCISIYQMRMN